MHSSLIYWNHIILPLLEAAHARTLVEVGTEHGIHTRSLLEYCKKHDGIVHSIDIEEPGTLAALFRDFGDLLQFHQGESLNILPQITSYDALILDGDHNWYTVFHELHLTDQHTQRDFFPITFIHDTGWPYGRRDCYQNPDHIPPAYKQALTSDGLNPESNTPEHGGFNDGKYHALHAGTLQNGVLTAVEDFVAHSNRSIRVYSFPGLYGLSVLIDDVLKQRYPIIESVLNTLQISKPVRTSIERIEQARLETVVAFLHHQQETYKQSKAADEAEETLHTVSLELERIRAAQNRLQNEKQELQIQNESLHASLLKEHEVLQQKDRDMAQKERAIQQNIGDLKAKEFYIREQQQALREKDDLLHTKERTIQEQQILMQQRSYDQKKEYEKMQLSIDESKQTTEEARRESLALIQKLTDERQEKKQLKSTIQSLRSQIDAYSRTLESVKHSRIWKLTKWFQHDETPAVIESDEDGDRAPRPLIGCTIASANYLAQVRVLARSFLEHHPEAQFVVLLVDAVPNDFNPEQESFALMSIDELPIENRNQIFFQYTCRELNTAVKPAFLEHLFTEYDAENVLYLDPDICVYAPLYEAIDALSTHSIVLTPHLLQPMGDDVHPDELDILKVGAANLGFIGLNKGSTTNKFLNWWQQKLLESCFEAPERGLFFDQKWIDLVPSLFGDTFLLRHPGYNVAFWNMQQRSVEKNKSRYTVNGRPLVFYHFSGYRPENPEAICHYSFSSHSFTGRADLKELFAEYHEQLLHENYKTERERRYRYDVFSNGVFIAKIIRQYYFHLGNRRRRFGNPFNIENDPSFFDWLQRVRVELPHGAYLTNLHYWIYESRPEIHAHFPRLKGESGIAFAQWLLEDAQREAYQLDNVFLSSLTPLQSEHQRDAWWQRTLRKRNSSRVYRAAVETARTVLPARMFDGIRNTLEQWSLPPAVNVQHSDTSVHVVGYIRSENGVGEAARATIRSLQAADIPHAVSDFKHTPARREDISIEHEDIIERDAAVRILHVNADQVPVFTEQYGEDFFRNTHMIGYWYWELSMFPERWHDYFRLFDEIWVGSTFCQQSIEAVSPIPVRMVPPSLGMFDAAHHQRSFFGMPDDHFVFLFMFDFYSVLERKNPFAILDAFEKAFSSSEKVTLYIKCTNTEADPIGWFQLKQRVAGMNCILQPEYYSRDVLHDLIRSSDAYVSLHRSEGFGLSMAESMALGKPVIATNYSANTDFMNEENSFPVDYRLVELKEDYGPYDKGCVWAEPNIDDAARLMRFVYEHPAEAARKATLGSESIYRQYAPERIGSMMREVLASHLPL